MPIRNLLNGAGDLLDGVGDTVESLVNPLLPGVGAAADDVVDGVAALLRGAGETSPLGNLFGNSLLAGGTGSGSILGLGLLNEDGVLVVDLLGNNIAVLPQNGGIVTINDAGLLSNGGVLDLGGLLGEGGLLNLGGLLGPDGIIDLSGVLGAVLGLLTPDASLDPDDYLDEDGNVDQSKFEKVLIGTEGRDTFSLTENASTYVDGRGGLDTVNFASSVEGFAFASGANAVLFVKDDKAYYFENVERVSFFEGQLYLDTGAGENAGMAYRLYQAAFDRAPDNDGVKWWVDAFDNGLTGYEAASGFIASNEFKTTYGKLGTEAFVEAIYENVLGRGGESAGVRYWIDEIDSGRQDRATVLFNFSESSENIALVGQVIENGYTLS